MDASPSPRRRRARRPLPALLAGLALLFAAGLLPPAAPRLMEVSAPAPGERVDPGPVRVMVRFDPRFRVAPETFRVLLNGADVTPELLTGRNGAIGELHGVLDGINVLRFEVFGSGPGWGDRLFEQRQEVHVLVRTPQTWTRG